MKQIFKSMIPMLIVGVLISKHAVAKDISHERKKFT